MTRPSTTPTWNNWGSSIPPSARLKQNSLVHIWLIVSVLLALPAWAQTSRQTWDTESGLPQNSVHAIAQTPDGYMWFGTEGGLARFDSIRFAVFNTRNTPQLHSNDIRSLLVDGANLWIATADGVGRFSADKLSLLTTQDGLPGNNISLLYRDSANRPCAVTSDGAACFKNGHFATAPDPPVAPLASGSILCTFKDREGNLWTGTESAGVTVSRPLRFQTYADRADNLDDVVRCVFQDRQKTIWMGTNSEGLVRYSDGKFTHLNAASGLSSNVIVSLGQDETGDLYIGTPDGLNRMHNGAISVITSFDGLPDDFIRSIHPDGKGNLWIGTRRGLSRIRDGRFQNFTRTDGLGSDLVGTMLTDSKGTLWIATLKGLSRFSAGHFVNFTTADGLSSNVITALYEDPGGTLWIGTQGGGLNRYTNGKFLHFPNTLGLPAIIFGITEDAANNLWLASDAGIFRVDRISLDKNSLPEVVAYGTSDGLRVSECSGGGHPALIKVADGSIWFATMKGAARLRPDTDSNPVPPPVVIESVSIDQKMFPPQAISDVRPGYSRIAFDYAALSFTAPQKVSFRYKLEGFDKDWINAASARMAYYTNLGPGNYRFLVKARNEDGVWSTQPAALPFHLQPHFYQTWWFWLLVFAALGVAAFAIYRWRVLQVKSQFNAVLQERNRIAREIHDTLAQGFTGISLQLELVSKKLLPAADPAREHLDQARMLVRSSLAEARRSIWELRSQSSEMEDLAARLAKMAAQMGGATPGKVTLQVRGTYRPLKAKMEDELLRIAQEAVTNALRHAEASSIRLELAFDAKLLHMTVSDDGQGFSPDVKTTGINGHFGLQGMRERARAIGAGFDVKTAPGQGTTVSIVVSAENQKEVK